MRDTIREPKDHPLVKEIEGVVTAIEQCPTGPEQQLALMRAKRATDYAVTVISGFEKNHQGFVDTVLGGPVQTLLTSLKHRRDKKRK